MEDILKTAKEVRTVKSFVFTASVVNMVFDSKPVPNVLDESCWSDPHMLRE